MRQVVAVLVLAMPLQVLAQDAQVMGEAQSTDETEPTGVSEPTDGSEPTDEAQAGETPEATTEGEPIQATESTSSSESTSQAESQPSPQPTNESVPSDVETVPAQTPIDEASVQEVISVFSQKGGMLLTGEHSVYLRTNDEWNGFSSFYIGYRYGATDFFQISFEVGAAAIPHVYLAAVLTHWRLYESPNKFLFIGLRTRTGYRYQDSDFSSEGWEWLGDNYLTLQRNGIYMAFDFTIALRFGRDRRHTLYYSIYPRIDIDFVDAANRVHVLFSPVMLGYELRWRRFPNWSFAIEAGYTFPIPWDSIPEGQWVNFPSLGNFGFYRRW